MSHIIRQQPNGLWCLYSKVVEDIILYDAEKEDIVEYKLQKERERMEQKLEKIEENGYNPPKANQTKSLEDILEKSRLEIDNDEELVDPSSCSEEIESMEERF